MPSLTMTVKLINPPGSTGRGSIVGTDDTRLGLFPEKVSLFEVGKTYEVEYVENERNGKTLRNVKSAKLIAAASAPAQQQPAPTPQMNGNGNGHPAKDEQIFVQGVLQALIRAGEIKNDKTQLFHSVQMLRLLYQHTFGNGSAGADANRPRLVAAE